MAAEFVLDNSIVMSWCFEDESSDYADEVLDSMVHARALVPAIWPLEVSNVLVVAERRKRILRADSLQFMELLSALPIEIEYEISMTFFKEIYYLARETNLSSYDASYLDLALKKGIPLASLDSGLLNAANQLGVPIYLEDKR